MPSAVVATLFRLAINEDMVSPLGQAGWLFKETYALAVFNSVLGFLMVFRVHQASSRFWEASGAVYKFQADLFDTASALVSFTSTSSAPAAKVIHFKHTVMRLLSLMHAAAMGSLLQADGADHIAAFSFEMIDSGRLDSDTRAKVKNASFRVELVFTWVMNTMVGSFE